MMTWKLWRALRWPLVKHPLYGRIMRANRRTVTIKVQDVVGMPTILRRSSPFWGFIGGAVLVFFVCSGGWLIVLPLLCLAPMLMVSVGTVCGLICAMKTARSLTRERQEQRFDLISLTPWGAAGAVWAAVTATYHNSSTFKQLRDTALGIYALMGLGTAFLFGTIIINVGVNSVNSSLVNTTGLILIGVLYLDLIQSTLIGCVIGMLVPLYVGGEFEARGLSFGAFLAAQFLTYAVIGIAAFYVLPLFDWQSMLVLSLVRLVIFFAGRELLLIWLWRLLANRLESNVAELNLAAGIAS